MRVGELLTRFIEQGDQSKNNIIREVHIDRSSFYKILSGERRPTDDQLTNLIRVLEPESADLEQLLDAYEQELAGEGLCQQRAQVRAFMNSLSEVSENEPAMPDALRQFILDAIHQGVDRYQAFLPIGSRTLACLFALLNTNQSGAEIHALIAIGESTDGSILHALSRWFRYLRPQTARFHAYTLCEMTRGLEALPFPYYLIAGPSVLLISGDGTRFLRIEDPQTVAAFHENYERQIAAAEEIASTETSYEEILRFFTGLWQNALAEQEEIYLLSPRPCMYLCSTDEMVRKYMHEEDYVQYGRMIRSLNMREFTTRTGMQRFLDEFMLCEAGFQIPVDPADMENAHQRILQNTGVRTFYLHEERVHLPQDWQIFIIARRMVVFVPFQSSTYIMCATSSAVVEPLAEWCESRCGSINNDIVRS